MFYTHHPNSGLSLYWRLDKSHIIYPRTCCRAAGSRYTGLRPELPKSFDSISRICLISNDWNALNRNIAAVHDRGPIILFRPTALEVHRELARGRWFDDEEVFDFVGRSLFLVTEPSFRFYRTARDHKQAGLDWRDLTLRTMESGVDPKLILVARLLADPKYDALPAPEAARVAAFKARGGGSKATYHRYKDELLKRRGVFNSADVGAIKLEPAEPDRHLLALLDRRQQIKQMGQDSDDTPPEVAADLLSRLQHELERAIAQEDFERAAELRDEICRLQQSPEGQET